MSKSLYLIDGHAQVYRAFYAVEGLTTPDGKPSGAIYGFTRMLLDVIGKHNPDHLIAVFDPGGKTFRHEIFPEYKANRKPTPPELKEQIPAIKEIIEAYNIPVVTVDNFEADDVLGTLAHQAADEGFDTVIVTGDKDCAQLLRQNVRLYDHRKDIFTSEDDFKKNKGIEPTLLPDLFGLVGDSSDNIPGVAGIGEKTALKLITDYGSLEGLLEKADEIKGKRGDTLRESFDVARLSKELATIDTHVDVRLDSEASERQEPNTEKLVELFEKFGFKTLLKSLDSVQTAKAHKGEYRAITNIDELKKVASEIRKAGHVAVDTETTALDPMQAELVGISLSWEECKAVYLPFMAPQGENTLGSDGLESIKEILEDANISKTGQNIKYDDLVLQNAGIKLSGITFDSLLASNILQGHLSDHGIDALASRHLGIEKIPTKELIGTGQKQITMDAVPLEKITQYACEDADVALMLERKLGKELKERNEEKLLADLELPLSFVLTRMQATGIRVDSPSLGRMSKEAGKILGALQAEVYALAGREFNISSPKQLSEVLFEEMNLPAIKKTKTGYSTNEAVLTELAAMGHELPERILAFRMYSKLKSTYLDALPEMVNPKTGRIHTTFSQSSTATGRLASKNPNLQNIPVRSEYGRTIRSAFIPKDGWEMLAADYSQIELRMLAHFSQDEMMIKAFTEGMDVHRVVAAEVNHIQPEDVTSEQRSAAKAINFGIIYGQSAHGLSQQTGMNRAEAQRFIDHYFERFPSVRNFISVTKEQAKKDGFAQTILGRRREIPDLASSNKMKLMGAERMALNTKIQGSAADLIKRAMITLDKRLKAENLDARMLLQIHDELIFEVPPQETEKLREIVREEMENALPSVTVPLTVEIGVGKNWLEAK